MQEEEARIESKNSGNSDKNSGKKDSKGTTNSNQPKPQSSSNSRTSASSSSNAGSKTTSKDKPKNSISDKLGKNGKLTGDEREHRLKEGLCLYCGEKGHVAQDCPKSKAAKARAATVTAESKLDSVDSKK